MMSSRRSSALIPLLLCLSARVIIPGIIITIGVIVAGPA